MPRVLPHADLLRYRSVAGLIRQPLWQVLVLVMVFRALAPALSAWVLPAAAVAHRAEAEATAASSGRLQLLALCSVSGMRWVVDPTQAQRVRRGIGTGSGLVPDLGLGLGSVRPTGPAPSLPDAGDPPFEHGLLIADHGCLLCAAGAQSDGGGGRSHVAALTAALSLHMAAEDLSAAVRHYARPRSDPAPRAPPAAKQPIA